MNDVSRRQFIAAGVAGLSALYLGGPRVFAGPENVLEKYGGFKMGIQSFSLRHFDLAGAIDHIADLGLHWVEFYPGHFRVTADTDRIDIVNTKLARHSIQHAVHGVHSFDADEMRNRELFEFARLAGIPVLSANPSPDSFPILHDLVQEYDIRIGIHNHGPGHRYDRAEDSLEAVEKWDKRIGFCPDTGHAMRSGEDPVEVVRELKDRLYGIHLKDHDAIHRDEPPETILGEGALDLKAFCETLRDTGFNEPISLEYELNPENPIEDIRKGLSHFARAAQATK